jgi:rhamnosyl/mannosyltransferase
MGGVEQVIHQLGSGGVRYGLETAVLSLAPGKTETTVAVGDYLVHRARLNFQIASTGFSLFALLHFVRLAKKADIIHYHFPWPFMDLVHFLARVKKPTVVSYHSDIVRQQGLLKLYRPLKIRFLNSVDRIVAASPNYLASSDVLSRFHDKVRVVPYGLDKAIYPSPAQERLDYWRSRFGEKFFLFVGVLRYYKGLHILLDAAQGQDYPVVILGSGPIERELKEQAAQLGLRNVHFLGFLPDADKVALLNLCYSLVFPSHLRSEAFGISLLEGAMFGKPLISCEIGTGTSFINIADDTGLVIPPSDPAALRQAMSYLWDHPVEASEMGRRAEMRYWNIFTADQMVEKYASLYREVINMY